MVAAAGGIREGMEGALNRRIYPQAHIPVMICETLGDVVVQKRHEQDYGTHAHTLFSEKGWAHGALVRTSECIAAPDSHRWAVGCHSVMFIASPSDYSSTLCFLTF